jgi:ribosome modulation factor
MKATGTLEQSVSAFETFLSERAFQEGYAAHMAGAARTAIPERMNVFSGNWVEGWQAAAQDALAAHESFAKPVAPSTFRIPLLNSAAKNIRVLCLH